VHLDAALAVWRYSLASVRWIFVDIEPDPVVMRVLEALASGPKTTTEFYDLFSGHIARAALRRALGMLQAQGRVIATQKQTAGRPVTIWSLARGEDAKIAH
jgi:hypothetical protein